MTDSRLQPLLDVIAANIAAAVLAELREGIPNENGDESGQEQRRRGDQADERLSQTDGAPDAPVSRLRPAPRQTS